MKNEKILPALATILMWILVQQTEESIQHLKKIPKNHQSEAKRLLRKLQYSDKKTRQFCMNILVLSENPHWN